MSSIPIPARMPAHPNLRALNVLRDLPQVADLIELCFHQSMDRDGENYVREMRRASTNQAWMRSMENASSMPLNGYVWEQDGKIVGNASLILFRHNRQKIYMLANVAAHPDHRHRGIGRAVTEQVISHARQHGADELWLNARDDNPDALDLYTDLGFREHSRRTQWLAVDLPTPPNASGEFQIVPRQPRFWPTQHAWLERQHPNELAWYRAWNFKGLAPGLWNWLYLLFVDMNLRQWAALRRRPTYRRFFPGPRTGRATNRSGWRSGRIPLPKPRPACSSTRAANSASGNSSSITRPARRTSPSAPQALSRNAR